MERIVIRETNGKVFRFNGENQNTLDAWIRVDTPENEDERIRIKDNYGSYTWHRKKSNDNVRGKITDGKKFSFFFARYAYSDKFKYRDESLVTNDNFTYSALLAMIPFEDIVGFDCIKNSKNLMKILNPSNAVLLVIDANSAKDIVSATYTKKEEYINIYIQNKIEKLMENQNDKYRPWLREKLEKGFDTKLYNMLTNGYEQFQEFLSEA
jgi:hypothetical protein